MLPPELGTISLSLPDSGWRRLTVELPFGPGLELGEPLFYRSVIHSRARLTYEEVEASLAGREGEAEVAEGLRLAERLAAALRGRRFARGALRIETAEVAFAFDGEGRVERAWLESEPHAHMLVEELMILANEAVAGLLAGRRREALYRVHERPEPQSIERLLAMLSDLEVPTPPAPEPERLSPALAAHLAGEISERVSDYVQDSGRGVTAFSSLVLRSLKQARYDPHNLGHSGLASPAYCHFTSPIRRYPDLVCHRALLRELGATDEPAAEDLASSAEHASAREREAAAVEYAADEICLAWLLDDRLFQLGWDATFEGEITGLIGSGLFVRFGDVFEGFLPARRLPGEYFELNRLGTALQARRSGRRYRLGDPVTVRVEKIDRADGKVELSLGTPGGQEGSRPSRESAVAVLVQAVEDRSGDVENLEVAAHHRQSAADDVEAGELRPVVAVVGDVGFVHHPARRPRGRGRRAHETTQERFEGDRRCHGGTGRHRPCRTGWRRRVRRQGRRRTRTRRWGR